MLTSSPKKNKKSFLILNASFTKEKAIIPANVLRKKSQRTNVGFGNLYAVIIVREEAV